jgi:hypothetical protein
VVTVGVNAGIKLIGKVAGVGTGGGMGVVRPSETRTSVVGVVASAGGVGVVGSGKSSLSTVIAVRVD